MDDAAGPGRAVRTPEGTRRRVDAARAGAAQRVPKVPPSPVALWAVRIVAALLVARARHRARRHRHAGHVTR